MEINGAIARLLETLEESLWRAETRFDDNYMNEILAPDFCEFGRSGRIYRREDTLGVNVEEIRATLPLKDFKIRCIDENTVLVTYVSEVEYGELEIGNRSSLWTLMDGTWRLRFHQGTPVRTPSAT
jgi:hypothetical protein